MRVMANSAAGVSAATQAREAAQGVLRDVSLGWFRFSLIAPGYARLGRWKARRLLVKAATRVFSPAALPVLSALVFTSSCGFLQPDGSGAPILTPLPPELAKTKKAKPVDERTPWSYVLPIDHGVRVDESGQGHFRAPRFHGEHNGIDLLAPVGTPTFAACSGQAMAGVSASFGRWVHVICPVPAKLGAANAPQPWASFFYAHLDKLDLELDRWIDVEGGQKLGVVGKTGNARGSNIQPHLHLELIVQRNRRSAMDERHLGNDQSDVPAAGFFASALETSCLDPAGFQPKSGQLQRARRLDPFLALVCLSPEKPSFVKAPEPLHFASTAWSDWYEAKDFNVNRGRR